MRYLGLLIFLLLNPFYSAIQAQENSTDLTDRKSVV